ncbi:MAG: Esterase EstD [Chlamydiae bacterium]|nr:Esterase EstD [Chlamydiota bacterium]
MKHFIYLMLTCLAGGALMANTQSNFKDTQIESDWTGQLHEGAMKLTLILHVVQEPSGQLNAKIDCIEQGLSGMPIDTIVMQAQSVKFELKKLKASFEGSFNGDRTEISGIFSQMDQKFPLVFKQGIKSVEALKRPQEPKPPYPYIEEEVSYENKVAGITLSGTLTLPCSKRTFPVVLLIAGSGPNDRDETILGHKPFLVLADHLTRNGIAVLRVDKRGVGKSTGNYDEATTEDFSSDVLAGIEYLKTRKEINFKQIGLIGHSEGGIIAPMIAAKSKDVAFIVMMAGCGVNGEKILYEQGLLIQRALGKSEDEIAKYKQFQEQMFSIVKQESNLEMAEAQLLEIMKNQSEDLPAAKFINSQWFRDFLIYEPTSALKLVKIPVLALNGELDLQVSPKQNLPIIKKALKEGGNKDYTIVQFPQLNHLFQTSKTGSISEYVKIEETIAPKVLNTISEWILDRTVKKEI